MDQLTITLKNHLLLPQALILLVGAFLSFYALGNAERFHPDEAFYMTIARHAAVNGDWLFLSEPLDKPPLTYYLNAVSLVIGAIYPDADGVLQLNPLAGEFAGRFPSTLMSILLVAVTMRFVLSLTGDQRLALLSGALMALTPLRIVFAPTAFTDLPMLLFGMIALWMASDERPIAAGCWFAMSLAAKPQSLFYLPLLLGFFIVHEGGFFHWRVILRLLLRFVIPIILGIMMIILWDSWRVSVGGESFYLLGQSRYTVTQLTPLSDYSNRLSLWWRTNQYIFGHGWLTISCLIYISVCCFYNLILHKLPTQIILMLVWVTGFIGIHIVLTLNLFDRNQLVLTPILIILLAFSLRKQILQVVVILLMLIFSISAAQWHLPIGGDDGRHYGIDRLADYLNEKPVATVIYDRWLDWQLDYYMGQWTNKRRVFYPTPDELLEGIEALEEIGTRYFVAPRSEDITQWLKALRQDYTVVVDYETTNFIVYAIEIDN